MKKFFLGIGSNLKNPPLQVEKALNLIKNFSDFSEFQSSFFYQTTPVSRIPQSAYVNAACSFRSSMDPLSVLKILKDFEKQLGKVEKSKEAPRLIDIDLLWVEGVYLNLPELQLPHPRMLSRLFVCIPLLDLTDEWVVLENGKLKRLCLKSHIEQLKKGSNESVTMMTLAS